MSQENVELARRSIEALNRRDLPAYLALMADDVEAAPRLTAIEGGYRGHEGLRQWWKLVFETWPDFAARVVGDVDTEKDVTFTTVVAMGRGRESALPLEWTVCWAARWRDGKCLQWGVFDARSEALEALSLSE
jgi:ketosteroid isomerase-like protein